MKLCRRCGRNRTIEKFYLRRKGDTQRQAYCCDCMRTYRRVQKETSK